MVDAHVSAAQRIDVLEKRLASLHDLGVDTVGLRSQLAFARTHLAEGRVDEVLSMCDDIEITARRLAEGSGGEQRVRTGRFTRDQLAEAIKDILGGGLFGKLMAEHRGGPDLRLETRLRDMDDHIRLQMASEADALRAEQQVLREEIEQMRRMIGSSPATANAMVPVNSQNDEATVAAAENSNNEPVWASRLHRILVKAIRRADAQATQIAAIVQQFSAHIGSSSASMAPAVDALRSGMSEDLKQLVERMPIIADHEPSWVSPLVQSLQAVADRLQVPPSRYNDATARTASANRAVADAHDHQPTDVIHAHASSAAVEPSGTHLAVLPPINNEVENSAPVLNNLSAATSDWTMPLITSLQAIVERLQAPLVPAAVAEPAWTGPLVASLQAVAERVQTPSTVSEVATNEPVWVAALIGNLQAMAERLPVGLSGQSLPPTDLATALGAVVERGLEGLGELIRQGQQSSSQAIRPADDTSPALSPITIPKQEDGTTRVFGQSSTRTNKIPVSITPALSDSIRSLVLHEIEARLGQTSMVTAKDLKPEQVRAMVDAEFDRRAGGAIERNDINDLRANFMRLLPNLLEDESVRQQLFAVLALEAISKPGALAELTGLRSFLKRELNQAATEIADRLQTT